MISRLKSEAPGLMQQGGVPGLSIALIRGGKTVWLHGFGVKDKKTGAPVRTNTVFEAASLSKPVFAYGVLKLVDQGKLDLDTPLSSYLAKPYIPDERIGSITARLVLSHRTGFPNWRGDDGSLPIYFPPGERFSYSGEGYIYLQRVVEQITGKPLEIYMDQAVFKPLGMTNSSYVWKPGFDALTATGYDSKGAPGELWKPKEAGAASSLNTTAKDYALFVDAVLNGKGLSSSALRQMETPEIALDPACRICVKQQPTELSKTLFWGLGWGIQREPKGILLWHWGDNGAFKAFVMADPAGKSGVVIFANGQDALNIAKPIIDIAMDADTLAFAWLK
ncbi:serine hydrolase domain-containing protein [Paludibaculum fermentans]|uniref:Beta-lactamase family protein n=1 Tax=Paludibaculum fermentans TaxID=1473598 RepID=A0A7S7NW86_PALFE|nr:serine hydrolase domain-containing protein [Paludibaculum fermentans]QOY90961.1 beta-lactamase family protein [Paludibaculum fermentans]